jgi:hypothetical protein
MGVKFRIVVENHLMTRKSVSASFAVALSLGLWMAGDAAAVQVTFNLVQAQSHITFGGDFLGTEAEPAAPFFAQDDPTFPTDPNLPVVDNDPAHLSNRTTFTGTITVDVDNMFAPTTIQILSADMDGTVTGSWLPVAVPGLENEPGCDTNPDGGTDTDRCSSVHSPAPATPADIGVKIGQNNWPNDPCCDFAYAALRDVAYNLATEIPDLDGDDPPVPVVESVNAQGEFNSTNQHLSYRRGYFEHWIQPFLDDDRDRDDVTGDGSLNQNTLDVPAGTITPIPNAPKSTYIVAGNLITLTIPVEVNVDNPGDLSQYWDGQFVATFEISAESDGDYNENGTVDAADYVAWRKLTSMFGGEPDGYEAWREQFGEPAPGSGDSGTVPEPTSAVLLVVGLTGALFGPGRRRL